MKSHKIEFPTYIRISYTISPTGYTETKDFKTAYHAARWYAEQWNQRKYEHLPYTPFNPKQAVIERRVKKIFKKYLP
jgi:hypothetical protein